jgi:hypothetical protein
LEGSEDGTFCRGNTFSTIFQEEGVLFSSFFFLQKKKYKTSFLKNIIKLGSIHHPIQNIDYKLDKLIQLTRIKLNLIQYYFNYFLKNQI